MVGLVALPQLAPARLGMGGIEGWGGGYPPMSHFEQGEKQHDVPRRSREAVIESTHGGGLDDGVAGPQNAPPNIYGIGNYRTMILECVITQRCRSQVVA